MKTPFIHFLLLAFLGALGVLGGNAFAQSQPAFIWWEGEDTTETNFPENTWFSPQNDAERNGLSGESWLTNAGPATDEPAFANYTIQVPDAGEYQLWARKFWKHGPFHWRFNNQPWQTLGRDIPLTDRTTIRLHVDANWVPVGKVTLPEGDNRFKLRLAVAPGEPMTCAFDSFVLSSERFIPRGKLKPGESLNDVEAGHFLPTLTLDPFNENNSIDLRYLNETIAGQSGPLQRDGDHIALGDGTHTRFWGVNIGHNQIRQPNEIIDYTARRLAKLGVNMARIHDPLWLGNGNYNHDPARLERLQYAVSAFKQQGIYANLSWYFPLWISDARDIGLEGYEDNENKKPFAVVFFNTKAQEHYLEQLKAIVEPVNPHTGLSLAHDPALGVIELMNEDNLFFWTFNEKAVPPKQWEKLERLFAGHLVKKYGSLNAAFKQWPRAKHDRDDAKGGVAGVWGAWHMTRDAQKKLSNDEAKRAAEQAAFLAQLQRSFYEKAVAMLRGLGYEGLISCGNWHTGDPPLTDALERWTYTAGDLIDHHGYYNAPHDGEASAYSLRLGHTFSDQPAPLFPRKVPLRLNQVAGYPSMVSEFAWTNPNRLRADGTLVTAALGSIQGIDALCHFTVDSPTIIETTMNKFPVGWPSVAGMFPGNALMYRRGDLKEGPVVAHEALKLEELFELKQPAVASDAALDKFRQVDMPPGAESHAELEGFDPMSQLVGRVTRSYDVKGDRDSMRNLSKQIDHKQKRVASFDDELVWDFGEGHVSVNTPRCQAAAGYMKKHGPFELGDVTIDMRNDYGQVLVISLDRLPIAESKRLLIQAVSREKLYGSDLENGKVTKLGRSPINVELIDASVTLPSVFLGATAVSLDGNGDKVESLPIVVALAETGEAGVRKVVGGVTIELPGDRLYVLVERE